jgi:hypothetical protein
MTNPTPKTHGHEPARPDGPSDARSSEKPLWETPKMEDVSEQVMAQPYIRFT